MAHVRVRMTWAWDDEPRVKYCVNTTWKDGSEVLLVREKKRQGSRCPYDASERVC